MSEQLLDAPHIRTTLEKVGCEGMPECVRCEITIRTYFCQSFLEPFTDRIR